MIGALRAEWTKFRTVWGWVLAVAAAVVTIVGLGVTPGMSGTCDERCRLPVGPDGGEVTDSFTFVHAPLTGDGGVTARLSALTGIVDRGAGLEPGLERWSKGGLLIKAGTGQGATYAAVMLTGGHGLRFQHDFTGDVAFTGNIGGAAPVWLRLTRSGETITGAASADGVTWQTVGSARLPDLPATATAGFFATSPQHSETAPGPFAGSSAMGGPTWASASFDGIGKTGSWGTDRWSADEVGARPTGGNAPRPDIAPLTRTAAGLTVTGTGDIAPAVSGVAGLGTSVTQTLAGTFIALLLIVVVAALTVTAEYRRGLIRTTFAAVPGRGRVLAAKALVIGGVTFAAGLLSAAVVMTAGPSALRGNGVYVNPVPASTSVRLIVGTAALLAVAAVLAMAVGAVLRQGAAAVATVVVLVVLPYLLSISVLPAAASDPLLTVTPAAGFAVQQSALEWPQVDNLYLPVFGYFPLPPWAGLGVLCAWAAAFLLAAGVLIRRRDA